MLNQAQRSKLRKARQSVGLSIRKASALTASPGKPAARGTAARKAVVAISHMTWQRIETGEVKSDLETIRRMAEVVNLDLRVDLVKARKKRTRRPA